VESVIARILVATRCITIEKKSSEISGQKVFVGHFIQPRVHCLLKISEWLFSTDHPRFRCPLPLARKTRETEHGVYTCPPIPLSSEILFLNSIHHFGDCSSCTHKSFCHTFLKAQEKNIECTCLLIYEGNLIIIRSIYVRVTYNNILVAV